MINTVKSFIEVTSTNFLFIENIEISNNRISNFTLFEGNYVENS